MFGDSRRIDVLIEELREDRRRADERDRRTEERHQDFSRRMNERYEQLLRDSEERYREQLQITREVVRRNELAFRDQSEILAELVSEVRAMREGLFALIDELRHNGPDPATT